MGSGFKPALFNVDHLACAQGFAQLLRAERVFPVAAVTQWRDAFGRVEVLHLKCRAVNHEGGRSTVVTAGQHAGVQHYQPVVAQLVHAAVGGGRVPDHHARRGEVVQGGL